MAEHPRVTISKLLTQHSVMHEITERGAIHIPVQTTRQLRQVAKMGRKIFREPVEPMLPHATIEEILLNHLNLFRGVQSRYSVTRKPTTRIVKISFKRG